jgi:arginyl-tRNA synthetase
MRSLLVTRRKSRCARDYPGTVTPSELGAAVRGAVQAAVDAGELAVMAPAEVAVERPRVKEHGDYATSIALQLAKAAGRPPREVAELLAARLRTVEGIAEVDVAGPGFLNLRLAQASLGTVALTVLEQGAAYGTNDSARGQRVNLEFVSANPTGPIHLGGVRWAAVGDALARLLQASGADVVREYYVNDAGLQIDRFAASLLAAAKGEPVPEDGYAGSYVPAVAARALWRNPGLPDEDEQKVLDVLRSEGVALMLDDIRGSLGSFGVEFDVWFSELSLASSGAVDRALARLREQGHVYELDGAVWLRTTDFGDDKDRVLVKSDGSGTYFLSDCAYYIDKRERGFDRCIYMLGADHHGYVGRLRAIAACAGDDPKASLEVRIGQMVNVLKGGEPIRMSKRAGTIVTLDDLLELTGADAARYALARSSTDSTLDLDVDLVTRQSSDNPVFYVQYAATRAASVLRNAAEMGIEAPSTADLSLLTHPREAELLLALAEFPQVVATAAELREPHRVARYLEEKVAKSAQRFWDDCQVLPKGDEDVAPTTAPRLLLWRATRVVLENGLRLLGVSAPERM